jgi:hypothetical protein
VPKATLPALILIGFAVSLGCGSSKKTTGPGPSNVVVAIQPATLTQGVGLVNTFSATVTGAADSTVIWSVDAIAGGDSATVGSISAAGRYRAPDSVPAHTTVTVKATSTADPSAYATAEVTIVSGDGTGLSANYSTGTEVLEGPIFHGYWDDCSGTEHNLYEGECTPVASSPVDWAWGRGWTVTWTGQLFVPYSGDFRFASRYWVDGIVYIEVGGTVVADLNTTGAGYSKTISLTGNTWVPIQMSFQPNGGSNNMHLGWVSPGGEWCPVARSYLKP